MAEMTAKKDLSIGDRDVYPGCRKILINGGASFASANHKTRISSLEDMGLFLSNNRFQAFQPAGKQGRQKFGGQKEIRR